MNSAVSLVLVCVKWLHEAVGLAAAVRPSSPSLTSPAAWSAAAT